MVMDNLSLDIDELNHQAEVESLMPAKLVMSEYKDYVFTNDQGLMESRTSWQLEWDRLDIDTRSTSGEKFLYRSTHNKDIKQIRRATLMKQVECFAKLGLRGRDPKDFLDAEHWIREVVEQPGTRFEKAWWRSEALYKEGQTYEEATGGVAVDININAPSSNNTMEEPVSESMDEGSPYDLLLNAVNGKNSRQALTALRQDKSIPEELKERWSSGMLVDELIEQNFLTEEGGIYTRVVSE